MKTALLVLLSIVALMTSSVTAMDEHEVLQEIITAHLSNRGKILTWEGSALVTDTYVQDTESRVTVSDVDYALDQIKETLSWGFVERDNPQVESTERSPVRVRAIRTRTGVTRLEAPTGDQRDNIVGVHPTARFAPTYSSEDFDPMYFFGAASGAIELRVGAVYDMRGNPHMSWKVSRDGNRVTIRSDTNISVNVYVIDLDVGSNLVGNLMSESEPNGQMVMKTTTDWTWTQVSGVWVPASVHYQQSKPRKNSTYSRVIEWGTQTVNGTIAKDRFSLAAIGAGDGDTVLDIRSHMEMTIKDGTLVPAGRTSVAPAPPVSNMSRYVANGTAIVAFLSLLIFVMRQRSRVNL
jgi:hypothetical protein